MASLQQLLRLRPFAATQQLAGSTAVLLSDLGVSVCSSSYINDQDLCQLSSAQISSRDTPNFPPSTPNTSGFSILNGQICSTGLLNSITIVTHDAQQSIVLPGLQEHSGGMLCHKRSQLPGYKSPQKNYEYKWVLDITGNRRLARRKINGRKHNRWIIVK